MWRSSCIISVEGVAIPGEGASRTATRRRQAGEALLPQAGVRVSSVLESGR